MAGFYGTRSVLRDLRHHSRTGKVTAGTLSYRGSTPGIDTTTDLTWTYSYVWPATETTALGQGGAPVITTQITLWQLGEAVVPRPDDKFTDSDDHTWLINSVSVERNADSGYAVHQCQCSREG